MHIILILLVQQIISMMINKGGYEYAIEFLLRAVWPSVLHFYLFANKCEISFPAFLFESIWGVCLTLEKLWLRSFAQVIATIVCHK